MNLIKVGKYVDFPSLVKSLPQSNTLIWKREINKKCYFALWNKTDLNSPTKIPLKGNGMAAISKNKYYLHSMSISKVSP